MKIFLQILISIFTLCAITGCATRPIEIQEAYVPVCTSPAGADVYIDATYVGKSPVVCSVKKDRNHILMIAKEGYKAQIISLKRVWKHDDQLHYTLKKSVGSVLECNPYAVKDTIEEDEQSCKWYEFEPHTVEISLVPEVQITTTQAL